MLSLMLSIKWFIDAQSWLFCQMIKWQCMIRFKWKQVLILREFSKLSLRICVFFGNALHPTSFIEKGRMSLFYVIKVCFHFAHLIYPKMNHGGPLFFSLICTIRFLVIVMVEHKGGLTLKEFTNSIQKVGRLYTCCSLTQVFNKVIWFIPLEANNF